MRTPWLTWVWPIVILLSTLAVTLITFLFPAVGIRPIVIMCFLFLIPGMTLVRFFRTGETAVEWMLAIALSFTIDAFVAGIILYAGQWSPIHIMSFLIGFCFSGALAQLVILRPISDSVESLPSDLTTVTTTALAGPLLSDLEHMITVDLAKPLPPELEDTEDIEATLILSKTKDTDDAEATLILQGTKDTDDAEATLILQGTKDTDDTQKQAAVFLHLQQLFRENAQEKKVSLEKPEFSGKEA
jgi:hypothetical protein